MASVNEAPLIGIVTVLYNSDAVLDDFFASLAKQEQPRLKLYVIDNSPTDSGTEMSRTLASLHGIDTTIVFNEANAGVARGNNQGIGMALADGCEYVLLANNDTDFRDPCVISHLLQRCVETGSVAAVPKIFYHGGNRIWCAGGWFERFKGITKHVGDRVEDHGQFDAETFTDYAPTCFMLLHKTVFECIGTMDETYFVYFDDTDFVWRMRCADIRLLYVPSSRVAHKVSASTGGGESTFGLFYLTRNRLYFSRKNLPFPCSTVSIAYSIVAMLFKYLRFSAGGRESIRKGLKAGLSMPIQRVSPARYVDVLATDGAKAIVEKSVLRSEDGHEETLFERENHRIYEAGRGGLSVKKTV
jgi:GT2 family glycosyltransferase